MPPTSAAARIDAQRRFPLPPSVLRRIDRQLRDDARLLDRRIARLEGDLDAAPEVPGSDELTLRSRLAAARASRDEVHAALLRLLEGRFGECERCGGDIRVERLELAPTTRCCTGCAPPSLRPVTTARPVPI